MPLLAAWIGNLFTGLSAFFATWFTRQIAVRLTVVALFISITTGMIAGIYALFSGITYALPEPILIGASWIVPTNAQACLSAIISAKIIAWAYSWNVKILQYKMV